MIRVAGFLDNSTVNGEGLRSVLFVSGCIHNCPGCQNKPMQDFNYGDDVNEQNIINRIKSNMPLINGVTFSGGEPLLKAKELIPIAKEIKNLNLNLWCYTGYTIEELLERNDKYEMELLEFIDILIDGKFEENLTEGAHKYMGSSNQRVLKVKEYLKVKLGA